MKAAYVCAHCGASRQKERGAINRAREAGLRLFCGRVCSGLGRRKHKDVKQKKAEKAAYDREYHAALGEKRLIQKREYHARTYDPVKAAVYRGARMDRHVEYCRRPEYRVWKQQYDQTYRANKEYGPFAEAFLVLLGVENEIKSRATDYEIRTANETVNKTIKRKREYAQATGDATR